MTIQEFLSKLTSILDETRVGLMGSVDEKESPHLTWMTPALLKGRPGVIFAVSSPYSYKVMNIKSRPQVEWVFQNRSMDYVLRVKGKANIIDNPALKTEVMETIGSGLNVFWKINNDDTDMVVIETIVEEAFILYPNKGISERVSLLQEE